MFAAGTLLGAYEITGLLGAGGMGEVYSGRDMRLDRPVALKVLPAAFAADPRFRQRFDLEARVISRLNHPQICTAYDIGDAQGVSFLVMELVEGETLGAWAGRQPARTIADIVAVVLQISRALAAAHTAGIVHRDIKPDNVIVRADGSVKVLDFGVATLAPAASEDATTGVGDTEFGTVIGTTQYMSPEQARGVEVDERSDIFSLGIVLYELLTGQQPFGGVTATDTRIAILQQDPTPVTQLRPDTSSGLARIVAMCLEKDPTRRYASGGALAADLEALARSPAVAVPGPSIAVLPFVNLSPDPQNEYFADGVTEEIITVLSQVRGLRVAARNSAFAFKGVASDPAAVAARLNVGTLLTGSVRAAGGRLRIAVQLVDAAQGFQLWSERFDRPQDDVFAIQDEIAATVASRLQVTLTGGEAERTVTRAASLEAYHHFLRGRTRFNRRELGTAAADFQEAIRLDPEYAPAHALLATVLSVIGLYGIAPGYDVFRRAKRAAQRAIALDGSLPDATSAAFFIGIVHDWDWESIDTLFTRVPRQARSSLLLNWHSLYLSLILGRTEQAIEEGQAAEALDPLSGSATAGLQFALLQAGRFAEAEAACRHSLELEPTWTARRVLGLVLKEIGRLDEALEELLKTHAASPGISITEGDIIAAYVALGDTRQASARFESLLERARTAYVLPSSMAAAAGYLGRTDEAFEWLERAYREGDGILPMMNYARPAGPLRLDARFGQMMRRIGLVPAPDIPTS
jgi:TolB-like protein/predicted Ser/Thr protein kinase